MGLDMNLYAKIYVGAEYEHRKVTGTVEVFSGEKKIDCGLNSLVYLVYNTAYWRKANHIHKWFVDNVQDGKDECQESYVPLEKLEELIQLCKKTLKNKNKAVDLLPTSSGFFFGSTEYDEYYYDDIKKTVQMLEAALKTYPDAEFTYNASW